MAKRFSLVAILALAACTPSQPAADLTLAPEAASAPAPTAADPSGAALMRSQASTETAAGLTPDGHTFHTAPRKVETVVLPQAGADVWSAHGYADGDFFRPLDSKDETSAAGAKVRAVRFEMLASGTGRVRFEKRASDNPEDPVLEVRTVHFMVH